MSGYCKDLDIARALRDVMEAGVVGEGDLDPATVCAQGLEGAAVAGARLVLQVAMATEVAAFLGRHRYERGGEKEGYRNGHRRRRLSCGSGSFEVAVPKVTGAAGRSFQMKSVQAYERTSEKIRQAIPQLYAEGLSTRDFGRALSPLWEEAGLSRSSVSRANRQLYDAFDAWRKRDLSGLKVLYIFLDAIHAKVRANSQESEGILVAHAILEDGKRELLAIRLGPRESEAAWKELLEDLVRRGLKIPGLAVSDGCPGLIAALKGVWPKIPRQRCVAHKMRNVLDRVPKKHQTRVKRDIGPIFHAPDLKQALAAVQTFLEKYGDEFPTACEVLARDITDCLTFYRFPEAHWKRIRTSNVIERLFREVRRRTNVVGRFPNERSALVLAWATMEQDRLRWRGVRMTPSLLEAAVKASETLAINPIVVQAARKYLAAA